MLFSHNFTLHNPKFYVAYPKILNYQRKILAKELNATSKQPKRLGL